MSRAQLLALGVGSRAVEHRLGRGRLQPVHRGVYAVGHRRLSAHGRWMAAVLATGPGAVLSHRSAAALWEMRETGGLPVEVTAPAWPRSRRGLRIHRSPLAADEKTEHAGIPVTTPARTLLDLAATLRRHQLERAAEEVERRALSDPLALDDLLARHPRRRGARLLRAIVDSGRITKVTRSDLEARFLTFLSDAGLPAPAVNARVRAGDRRLEVDFSWRARRVAVELDGHAYHSTPGAFERDRERDRALQAAGWRVVRVTWRQLRDDPATIAADLAKLVQLTPP